MLIIDQNNKNQQNYLKEKGEYRTNKQTSIDTQNINKESSLDIRNSSQ